MPFIATCLAFLLAVADTPTPSPKETVSELVADLGSASVATRMAACNSLKERGRDARTAVPDLRRRLEDSEPLVRALAARALWHIAPEVKETIPCLISLFKSERDPGASCWAGVTLLAVGDPAVPFLTEALNENDARYRWQIVFMLAEIGREKATRSVVPGLTRALTDEDNDVRKLAAEGLKGVPAK